MLRERLGKELLYFDGGMGTLLQERGLQPGELPETWNLLHAEEIREIHRKYIEAGKDLEGKGFDPRKLLAPGFEAIKVIVKEKMELFGSINKA